MSMQKVSNSGPKLMQGNEACAAGALAAGVVPASAVVS